MHHRISSLVVAALGFVSLITSIPSLAQSERLRTFWHGHWVEYVEIGDSAVTEGDIIIGQKDVVREWAAAALRGQTQMRDALKALTVDASADLWLRGPSGLIEVPYVATAGNQTNINAAIAEVNRALAGTIQWVARTTQTDYVSFNLLVVGNGGCSSYVGRAGGSQEIKGDPECSAAVLIHEMGHAMGLWHIQSDADRPAFVDVALANMAPASRFNTNPNFNTRTINGYDYASIMHYGRLDFSNYAGRKVMETRPPGMDIRASGISTYSAADLDALFRLYGKVSQLTTVTSNPVGLNLVVDGVGITTPQTFPWPIGSVHRIWASDGLQVKDGFNFAFGRWGHDPRATPSSQLTWQVTAGDGTLGMPATAPGSSVLSANFVRLIGVNTTSLTPTGGSLSVVAKGVNPWPGTASLYPQFSTFDLTASAFAGYYSSFSWSNGVYGFAGGAGYVPMLSMLMPAYTSQTIGGSFTAGPAIAIALSGAGTTDPIEVRYTPPGGTVATSLAPRLSRTTPGLWKYEFTSPQTSGASRMVVDGIDGLDDTVAGTVAMPTSGLRVVTVRAHRELQPFRQVKPSCAGTVTLSNTATWVASGTAITATLTPAVTASFVGWSGSVTGTATRVTTNVGEVVPEFVASFNTLAEPLTITRVTPRVMGDEATTMEITGTGFAPTSRIVIDGATFVPQYVDAHMLRLTLNRVDVVSSGRLPVQVTNALSASCSVYTDEVAFDVLPRGTAAGVTLTEYYNAGLDYYFLTGRSGDKAALDTVPAWARTGRSIKLFAAPTVDTVPLERHFFAKVAKAASRGSHFFTALATDQILFTSVNPTNLPLDAKPYLEGVEGFAVPKTDAGNCPSGTSPIYRAFKGPPAYVDDGNHRFSTTLAQQQDMVNRLGWTDEGIVFCGLQ